MRSITTAGHIFPVPRSLLPTPLSLLPPPRHGPIPRRSRLPHSSSVSVTEEEHSRTKETNDTDNNRLQWCSCTGPWRRKWGPGKDTSGAGGASSMGRRAGTTCTSRPGASVRRQLTQWLRRESLPGEGRARCQGAVSFFNSLRAQKFSELKVGDKLMKKTMPLGTGPSRIFQDPRDGPQ